MEQIIYSILKLLTYGQGPNVKMWLWKCLLAICINKFLITVTSSKGSKIKVRPKTADELPFYCKFQLHEPFKFILLTCLTASLVISQNLLILKYSLKYIKINEPIQWHHTVQSSELLLFHLIATQMGRTKYGMNRTVISLLM